MNYPIRNVIYERIKQLGGVTTDQDLVNSLSKENIAIPDEKIILIDPNAHSFDFYRRYSHPLLTPKELVYDDSITRDHFFFNESP